MDKLEPKNDYYVRMNDDAMEDAGINDNDLLRVSPDNSIEDGAIIMAMVNEKMYVRRYFSQMDSVCLTPDNVNFPTIEVQKDVPFKICGVVTDIVADNEQ